MLSTVLSILAAVLMLAILIIIHELGHYAVGRLLKLPVVEFSVGFGPLIFGREKNGIQYSLRALPFGGYCAFDDEGTDGRPSFMQAAAWRRLVTFIAGPAMNVLIAYILAVVLLAAVGIPVANSIAQVDPGMPAAEAGLREGDVIRAVDGVETLSPVPMIQERTGKIRLTLENGGEIRDVTVETVYDEQMGVNRVGITVGSSFYRRSLWSSITLGASYCYDMMASMLTALRDLVTGNQDMNELVGIVGTVTLISTQTQAGFAQSFLLGMANLLNLAVLISLNLGIVNLLPIPAVDGGRIVFSLIEMIARRPVPPKIENVIHGVGFVLLFGLMILLFFKDIVGLIQGTLPI